MSGPTIVAIEGGVCAGKSTLAGRLSLDDRFTVFPEYVEWLRISGRPLPGGTRLDKLRAYLEVEQERNRAVGQCTATAVLDRSILTLIGFEFSMARLYLDSCWLGLIDTLHGFEISLPNAVILLRIDPLTRELRWRERGLLSSSIFVNRAFNDALSLFYDQVSSFIPTLEAKGECATSEDASTIREFVAGRDKESILNLGKLIDGLRLA